MIVGTYLSISYCLGSALAISQFWLNLRSRGTLLTAFKLPFLNFRLLGVFRRFTGPQSFSFSSARTSKGMA